MSVSPGPTWLPDAANWPQRLGHPILSASLARAGACAVQCCRKHREGWSTKHPRGGPGEGGLLRPLSWEDSTWLKPTRHRQGGACSTRGTGGLDGLLPEGLPFCHPPTAHRVSVQLEPVVTPHLCSAGTAVGSSTSDHPSKQPTPRACPHTQTTFLGRVCEVVRNWQEELPEH